MMTDPQTYYEESLQGQNTEVILNETRKLKKDLERLRNKMEDPWFIIETHTGPDAATELANARACLELAKQAMEEAGGIYLPSSEEIEADDFQNNVANISAMTLKVGASATNIEKRTIFFDEDSVRMEVENPLNPNEPTLTIELDESVSKEDVLHMVQDLYLGEWKDHYEHHEYGSMVMLNGTEWYLEIRYGDGSATVKKSGCNAYPYNFDDLGQLFGIEFTYDINPPNKREG